MSENDFANWQRTMAVKERFDDEEGYEQPSAEFPYGRLLGPDKQMHQIVGRDVRIKGGVYPGTHEREVIVVEEGPIGKNPERPWEGNLQRAYSELVDTVQARYRQGGSTEVKSNLLRDVLELTRKWLPSDNVPGQLSADERVDKFVRDAGAKKDGWMSLEQFMGNVGVCRHQALLAGYLLERAQTDGFISPTSKISVDRNSIPGLGAHAWVRYLNRNGQEYIIDPRQNFIGTVAQAEMMAEEQKAVWSYRRPEPKPAAPQAKTYEPKKAGIIRMEAKQEAIPPFVEEAKKRVKERILLARAPQQPLDPFKAAMEVAEQSPKLDIRIVEFLERAMETRLTYAASIPQQVQLLTNYLMKQLRTDGIIE